MFTGIVDRSAAVVSCTLPTGQAAGTLVVDTGYEDLQLGESVAVNGACLTVVQTTPKGRAVFELSRETFERTQFMGYAEAASSGLRTVHLERALQAGARLSGHWVQGHVDGRAVLTSVRPVEGCWELALALDPECGRYCVQKGSITLDGVSLTINQVTDEPRQNRTVIQVMIIPHTWQVTHFKDLVIGARLNVEVDVLAKLVERMHIHRENFQHASQS